MAVIWPRWPWATDRVVGSHRNIQMGPGLLWPLSFGSSGSKHRYLPLGMGIEAGDFRKGTERLKWLVIPGRTGSTQARRPAGGTHWLVAHDYRAELAGEWKSPDLWAKYKTEETPKQYGFLGADLTTYTCSTKLLLWNHDTAQYGQRNFGEAAPDSLRASRDEWMLLVMFLLCWILVKLVAG